MTESGQRRKTPKSRRPIDEDPQKTLEDLRLHQAELQMQNEELRRAQLELDNLRLRYFDLYDLAPVACFTIDAKGMVSEANFAASALLGMTSSALARSDFCLFILKEDRDIYYLHKKQLVDEEKPQDLKLRMKKGDGKSFWANLSMSSNTTDSGDSVCRVVVSDITELKQAVDVMAARSRLLLIATSCSLSDLLRATVDEAEALTGSQVGFCHFVDSDQNSLTLMAYSTNTTRHMCKAEGLGSHYPVNRAGVWVDAFREGKPVIHNDYASLPHRKGLPPGHALVVRELVVPVLRGGRIVSLLGVGNKPRDYDDRDVTIVGMTVNVALKLVLEEIVISAKEAAPVGLILTELVTNAVKYAFPSDRQGTVTVSLRGTVAGARLEVVDDGIGLPAGFEPSGDAVGMGFNLVLALAGQIKGDFSFGNGATGGTRCVVDFPLQAVRP